MSKLVLASAAVCLIGAISGCQQSKETPTPSTQAQSPAYLAHRTIERRAVEAAIWGMPIVAMDAVHQGFLHDLQANDNDIAYYSQLPDWKFQSTTPNASTHYIYSAFNLKKDGPVVLEVPAAVGAGLYGQLCDMWDIPWPSSAPAAKTRATAASTCSYPPTTAEKLLLVIFQSTSRPSMVSG